MTINVRIFHTNNSRDADFDPPGTHPATEVYRYTVDVHELAGFGLAADLDDGDTSNDYCVLNHAWVLFNIGDDPQVYGPPDPRAVEYRKPRRRSLMIGDAVAVDDRFYQVASGTGWTPLPDGLRLDPAGHKPGSTPYQATVPERENSPR